MIEFEEALKIIESEAILFGDELISLDDADGRVLAEDIYADRNYPPFNRAAMDGFALSFSDWKKGIRKYRVVETIYAGRETSLALQTGECFKIMTGARVPESANLIIRGEDSIPEGEEVTLSGESLKEFRNISREGEDAKAGKLLIKSPQVCTPQVISLLATVGKATVAVKKLPTVSIITTGNEVVLPHEEISSVTIRNSNRFLVKSLLKTWQITPAICRHVLDEKSELKIALKNALESEITIINGGVSAGDADYVPEIFEELGVRKLFHRVSIKPGKPIWVGRSKTGIVFALPGNPLSCLTTFTVFIESYLYRIFGFEKRPAHILPLLAPREKKNNLTEIFPMLYSPEKNGLHPKFYNGSGDITAGLQASGLGFQASDQNKLEIGDKILFFPFRNV